MKKLTLVIVLLIMLCILTCCSNNLTNKEDIMNVYFNHEQKFSEVAFNGNFKDLEKLRGVQTVSVFDSYVDISCGGSGMGSETDYYGIFYSESDNLAAIDVAGPKDELKEDGKGYRYKQTNGDNEYYVEALGNHYFYYEAHF